MEGLSLNEVEVVSGGDVAASVACFSGAGIGMRAGVGLGPWGIAGGALLGCAIGAGLYYAPGGGASNFKVLNQ